MSNNIGRQIGTMIANACLLGRHLQVAVVVLLVGVAFTSAAGQTEQQSRTEFRQLLKQHAQNWIIRYDADGSVHLMFIDDVDPNVACRVASQVDNFTLDTARSSNSLTKRCQE